MSTKGRIEGICGPFYASCQGAQATRSIISPVRSGKVLGSTLRFEVPAVPSSLPAIWPRLKHRHLHRESNYNALQLEVEKRFNQGGIPLGSFTFSKLINRNTNTVSTHAGTGATRPNVVAGADKKTHRPIQSRLSDQVSKTSYFNLGAFTAPGPFRFGNESRIDSTHRVPGIAN